MKTFFCILSFLIVHSCFGQMDSNLLAAGDWSKIVNNDGRHSLRGRLLVYDDKGGGDANHARVYLELQQVFQGGWDSPIQLYFGPYSHGLRFEVHDGKGQPVPSAPIATGSFVLPSYWVTVPCDATLKLRADLYADSIGSKPDDLVILQSSGCWIFPRNSTNDYYLSATFATGTNASALTYDIWRGTLELPAVKISGKH